MLPARRTRQTLLRAGCGRLRGWRMSALVLLVLALLFVQTLGSLHRVLHAPALASVLQDNASVLHLQVAEPALATDGSPASTDGWAQLFAGHQNPADCRSYDQLSHGDCVPGVPVLAVSLDVPAFLVMLLVGVACARRCAPIQAHGPPGVL